MIRIKMLKPFRCLKVGTILDQADGVAELWWKSAEDMAAATGTEAAAAGQELLEDERKFIDLANSPLWMGEENVVVRD